MSRQGKQEQSFLDVFTTLPKQTETAKVDEALQSSENLKVVKIHSQIDGHQTFGGTYCLQLQGYMISDFHSGKNSYYVMRS